MSDVLMTPEGMAVVRGIASERWAVYMRASNDRVLERLGAQLIVAGALRKLEPWRFREPNRYDRKLAIDAYEKKRQLFERVARIR